MRENHESDLDDQPEFLLPNENELILAYTRLQRRCITSIRVVDDALIIIEPRSDP